MGHPSPTARADQRFTIREGRPTIPGRPFWVVLDHAERVAVVAANRLLAEIARDYMAACPVLAALDFDGSARLYSDLTEETTP